MNDESCKDKQKEVNSIKKMPIEKILKLGLNERNRMARR